MPTNLNRRAFLQHSAAGLTTSMLPIIRAQGPGERPPKRSEGVTVLNPRGRVPVSLIVDDSTCLVNLAHFAIPQFAEVFPDQYKQSWRDLPREVPDAFVRKFGTWCHQQGVKGKYSIVPYPACVGWLDRDLPGWSRQELEASLELVRSLMVPDWDIHPELISHTWAIDVRTGRPLADRTADSMENWGWSVGKSADELTEYFVYALRVLREAGLICEGITTPGGFGNRVLPELARATHDACRDVFRAEIPHYFRHLYTDDRSVAPRVELASGLDGESPSCVVSIIGCTGDWFGGWDGLEIGTTDQFITEDGAGGRLPEVIAREEPAVLVCHWPGIYCNGNEDGFTIFREVVARLHASFDNLHWMKLSEISRYWAAKELTRIEREPGRWTFQAPYACPGFTLRLSVTDGVGPPVQVVGNDHLPLQERRRSLDLSPGTWARDGDDLLVCFDLPRGASALVTREA